MLKKFKNCIILLLCTCIFVSSSLPIQAKDISKIIESEEKRVEKINKLYDKKQDLYNKYFISGDDNVIKEMSSIDSQLSELGVNSYSKKELEDKINKIQNENNISEINPSVAIPTSTSNIKWSTYRYYTVIWGKLHEMQIVMAEPTLDQSGPLNNTDAAIRRYVNYGDGIKAAAITVLDIVAGEATGIIEGGSFFKSLYDIAKNTAGAMTSDQIVKNVDYTCITASTATFKYGFIKVDGQPDYKQEFVYVGNSVVMGFQLTERVNALENGIIVPKFINTIVTTKHKSPSYDSISLKVIASPVYDRCYVIYSKNESLRNIPYKYANTTYYHSVPSPLYVEHGLNMYELYQFFY